MDYRRLQTLFLVVVLLILWAGCSSDDPYGTGDPVKLEIVEAAYEPDKGTVVVRWEFRGPETVERFLLLRETGSRLDTAGVVTGQSALRSGDAISLQDMHPASGELIIYTVAAEGAEGRLAESNPVIVRAPGAQMRQVSADLGLGAIQVYWQGDTGGVAAYEVVRQSDDGLDTVVHRTGDVRETSFMDWDVQGNASYTYLIRTVMSNGVQLKSRQNAARMYGLRTEATIEALSSAGERMLMFVYPRPNATWLPILVNRLEGGISQGVLRILDFQALKNHGDVAAATVESRPVALGALASSSLSAIGPASLQGALGPIEMLVAGVHTETGRVVLNGYSYQSDLIFSTQWQADAPTTRTAMSMSVDGWLVVSAGRQIKAFDKDLVEVGSATVDAGEPGDIAVVRATFANPQGGVWAAFPDEGRLLRGEALAGAGLASVRWHDVPLPAGARPVALMAYDHDQVLALDAGNDQVLVFSGGGRQVVRWPVAGQNLEKGDLTTDSAYRRFVHVVDGTGRLFVFEP